MSIYINLHYAFSICKFIVFMLNKFTISTSHAEAYKNQHMQSGQRANRQ